MSETFAELLAELESHRLEVALVPARHPRHEMHFVRVVIGQNPPWYRRICAANPSSRRRAKTAPDTRVRRANVLAVLGSLAAGKPTRSRYVSALKQEAARRESCPF
ncbi:MAG TPA: hypothetical protein PK322_06860 [Opitutaceae bacterium]|nr:hypothetical protein [Opitutaceae bacterium]